MATSEALTARTTLQQWEYLAIPLEDAERLKKHSAGLAPDRLNEVGSRGWEAVGLTLKKGDLVAWPVVLLKRPIGSPSRY
jgi:hypothetical protein